jgi:hypothetical protein
MNPQKATIVSTPTGAAVVYSNAYIVVVARGLDLFFAIVWKRKYGVTISSFTRLYMMLPNPPKWAIRLNRFLDFFEKDHCELARLCDLERAQTAQDILNGKIPP